jgi:hypothetical protein
MENRISKMGQIQRERGQFGAIYRRIVNVRLQYNGAILQDVQWLLTRLISFIQKDFSTPNKTVTENMIHLNSQKVPIFALIMV